MKTVIFDLDGTLSDCSHRQGYVQTTPRNWDAFSMACRFDPPKQVVIELLRALFHGGRYSIVVCSGRSKLVEKETIEWLHEHVGVVGVKAVPYIHKLLMRPIGDHRDDRELKLEMLETLRKDGHEIAFVVDDRNKVVDMWREQGLTCFQCAPGDF